METNSTNMDPIITGAIISAGSNLLSGAANMAFNGNGYKKWRKSFDHQHKAAIEDWQMQNQYNLPVNQVNRLLQAGINPNSGNFVSEGGVINTPSSGFSPAQNADTFGGLRNAASDIASVVSADKTKADTKKTEAETEGQNINNWIAQAFGMPLAQAEYNKTIAEIENFKADKVYKDIVNSKAGALLSNQIKESYERGQMMYLDNLIKTEAFDDLVSQYGYQNAYYYAQSALASETAKYVPYNAESQRMSAKAAQQGSIAALMQANNAQALLPSMIELNTQQGRKLASESIAQTIEYLHDIGVFTNTPKGRMMRNQADYFKRQANRLDNMTENERERLMLDFQKFIETPIETKSGVDLFDLHFGGTSHSKPKARKPFSSPLGSGIR